jgi:hypothetical protein
MVEHGGTSWHQTSRGVSILITIYLFLFVFVMVLSVSQGCARQFECNQLRNLTDDLISYSLPF